MQKIRACATEYDNKQHICCCFSLTVTLCNVCINSKLIVLYKQLVPRSHFCLPLSVPKETELDLGHRLVN